VNTTKLVEWGITSVSVSPDMIDKTRGIIAEIEKEAGALRQKTSLFVKGIRFYL